MVLYLESLADWHLIFSVFFNFLFQSLYCGS
jgi:hypothetical protein